MKYITLLLAISVSLVSCNQATKTQQSDITKLQQEKTTLVKKIDSLNSQLKKIDTKIRKLDTSKPIQKITTLLVKDTIFNHYISLQGSVSSDKNILLNPETGGTIQRILVKEGQGVKRGQTLLQLDASILYDKVAELKNQLSLAQTTYERQERLWNQKIGSEMQYLNAKTRKEGLEKSLHSLYTQIGKMTIKAPFSGIIDEIFPKTGELAGPQTPLFRLINLNNMYIEADVPENYLKSITKGSTVIVHFEPIDKTLEAKVTKVSNYINPNNRSFKITINIPNKKQLIKPNMLADLKIRDFTASGVVLPSSLIQMTQEGSNFVFIVQKDSITTVSKRTLRLGKDYNNSVFVKEGLKAGELIVDQGSKFIKDADQVIID